jgi:hypothetical protein
MKRIFFVLASIFSFVALSGEECELSMTLKPETYYVVGFAGGVQNSSVRIKAKNLKGRHFPAYHTNVSVHSEHLQDVQTALGKQGYIAFELPNSPGVVHEVSKSEQQGYALYVHIFWLSESCSEFTGFYFDQSNDVSKFNFDAALMNYEVRALPWRGN